MGFLQGLFGRKPDVRNTTDAELNAIFVPLRDLIVDFKDRTKISWLVILPAVQKISARLLVKERGLESTRRLYAAMLNDIDNTQDVPSGAILDVSSPSVPPDQLAEVDALLWRFANDRIAKGVPLEHIAQAFGAFAVIVSEKVVDKLYVTFLLRRTYQILLSDDFA